MFRDKRWLSNHIEWFMRRLTAEQRASMEPLRQIMTSRLTQTDGDQHQRLRMLMQLAFTPRQVERVRELVRQTIEMLIDRSAPAGRMDVVSEIAEPLASLVISGMLGLPAEDRQRFRAWADDIYAFMGIGPEPIIARARRANDAAGAVRTYLAKLFGRLRAAPRGDLLSELVMAEEQGDRLTETELYSNVVVLLIASHETTTNMIGNTLLSLLRNPAQWQQLLDDPSLAAGAVEEGLRYESPAQLTAREASQDIEVGQTIIPRGDHVLMLLAAANRDADAFTNPDDFDIDRRENRHLALGAGAHFCLGAALARLEGQVTFETIARRMRGLRLAPGELTWRPYPAFRGLRSLPVEF